MAKTKLTDWQKRAAKRDKPIASLLGIKPAELHSIENSLGDQGYTARLKIGKALVRLQMFHRGDGYSISFKVLNPQAFAEAGVPLNTSIKKSALIALAKGCHNTSSTKATTAS